MHNDYIVFVDESGDHSLTSIDPAYPVFVLSFCVFTRDCYINKLTPALRQLKFDTFGHDIAILHEADIRNRRGAFSALGPEQREAFLSSLTDLIDACDFTLIAMLINKVKHKARYRAPEHPYHLALQFGLERLNDFLQIQGSTAGTTYVVCEARGKKEDAELELAFRRICDGDNRDKRNYPFDIVIADKKSNSEGLQLADLTARPIGLSLIKPFQANRAYDVLQSKFFTGKRGTIDGNGRKVFP
jgi:hypothetical protein